MTRILITGGSGFLGREIVELSDAKGLSISVCTGKKNCVFDNRVNVYERETVVSDEFDLSKFDIIINCAYPMTENGTDIYNGLEYIYKLICKAEKSCVKNFINISSQSVYDNMRRFPAKEEDPLCLSDVYSLGKYSVEKMLRCACNKMKYTNIRMASLIGLKSDKRVVNRFIDDVINQKTINILGGSQRLEYLNVLDAASAILNMASHIDAIKEDTIYNLGFGFSYTVQEWAYEVIRIGKEFGYEDIQVNHTESFRFSNNAIDSSKFYMSFGWKPSISIEETIRSIYKHKLTI